MRRRPAEGGIKTRRIDSACAIATAKSGLLPPKATRAYSRGSRPRSLETALPPVQFVADSPLEGTGFEPSVPLLQKALLGVANRDVGTSEIARIDLGGPPTAVPFAAGPMVRIRFPPAPIVADLAS